MQGPHFVLQSLSRDPKHCSFATASFIANNFPQELLEEGARGTESVRGLIHTPTGKLAIFLGTHKLP